MSGQNKLPYTHSTKVDRISDFFKQAINHGTITY